MGISERRPRRAPKCEHFVESVLFQKGSPRDSTRGLIETLSIPKDPKKGNDRDPRDSKERYTGTLLGIRRQIGIPRECNPWDRRDPQGFQKSNR